MTMRTPHALVCACGHKGAVWLIENDSPHSAAYEKYRLEGFRGDGYMAEPSASWAEAFEAMNPVCPECGQEQTPDNLA